MVDCHYNMLDANPKLNLSSPLQNCGHPEIDTFEHLNSDSVQHYQSLVGIIQYHVSLGRLDTNYAVMNLASFRAESRQGYLDHCKIVTSHLSNFKWNAT